MLTSAPHNHCRISGDQTTRRNFERTYIRRAPFRQVARSKRARVQRAAVPQPKPSDQETVEYVDTWSDVQFINMCRRAYGGLAGWQSPRSWKDGSETYEGMLEVSRALMKVKLCVQVHLSGLSFLAHQTTIRATADLPHRMSFTPHAVSSMCLNRQTYIGSHDLSYRMSRPVQTQVMLHQTGPGHNAAAKQQLALQGKTAAQQRDAVIKGFPKVPAWFRKVFPYSKWGAELNARITPAFFTWLVGPMHREETEIDGIVQKSSVHIKRCR